MQLVVHVVVQCDATCGAPYLASHLSSHLPYSYTVMLMCLQLAHVFALGSCCACLAALGHVERVLCTMTQDCCVYLSIPRLDVGMWCCMMLPMSSSCLACYCPCVTCVWV